MGDPRSFILEIIIIGGVTMKIKIVLLVLVTLMSFGKEMQEKRSDSPIVEKVVALNNSLSNSQHPDKVLLEIARLLMPTDISLETYRQNDNYKEICHLKVVKSANFGDFVSYDGYHLKKIIKTYPESNLADDAEYELISVILSDEYNFHDVLEEKTKLLNFIKKYPKSNLRKKAEERVKTIEIDLKNGGSAIYD